MVIRQTHDPDLAAIASVHERAFGQKDEAQLTRSLLADPSATPQLSLLAVEDEQPVGHVLFTKVRILGGENESAVTASILAPLAVIPSAQGRGIGDKLVRAGLDQLADTGVALVFVLGHPTYYPRFGFQPAGAGGLIAPFPIPDEHADAWMVLELKAGVLGRVQGQIRCADALTKEECWRE